MTVEELLMPRYKVIADYPFCPYKVGDLACITLTRVLLTVTKEWSEWSMENEDVENYVNVERLNTYPHLFRKLNWWEERSEEDMPEYVKPVAAPYYIFKVVKFTQDEYCYFIGNNDKEIGEFTSRFTPATEQEYNDYINLKSNAKLKD